MNLSKSQIESIALGVVETEETEKGVVLHRFTKEQRNMYELRDSAFFLRSGATSGVKLRFRTNSKKAFMKADIAHGSNQGYFAFEVFVNGKRTDTMDNFSNVDLPEMYAGSQLPIGVYSKEFDLGEGEKEVCIYFPWSVKVFLQEFSLDEGAWFAPVKPRYKLLCFGDSITQGYNALYPTGKYTTQLAELLDAEERNKAVGGEIFFPELAKTKEDYAPDYITVAYGTNDWNKTTQKECQANCMGFFRKLCENYPEAKIFAISPIWRDDCREQTEFGEFKKVEQIIRDVTSQFESVTFISGFDLVPHDIKLFADFRLHPNDKGFSHYFTNLVKHIRQEAESL